MKKDEKNIITNAEVMQENVQVAQSPILTVKAFETKLLSYNALEQDTEFEAYEDGSLYEFDSIESKKDYNNALLVVKPEHYEDFSRLCLARLYKYRFDANEKKIDSLREKCDTMSQHEVYTDEKTGKEFTEYVSELFKLRAINKAYDAELQFLQDVSEDPVNVFLADIVCAARDKQFSNALFAESDEARKAVAKGDFSKVGNTTFEAFIVLYNKLASFWNTYSDFAECSGAK